MMNGILKSGRILLLVSFCGWSCLSGLAADGKDEQLKAQALELAKKFLIVDTHVDLPYRLNNEYEDVSVRTKGNMDYVKAVEGGLDAPFMSIYTPSFMQTTGGSRAFADKMIDLVEGLASSWPDKFAVATSVADVQAIAKKGMIALPMGMENGSPIEDKLELLKHFYDRGVRYITLTHATDNLICDSSYDDKRTWKGLSPFGRQVVAEMNRLGIMIDISHVSDDSFFQVMELTKVPVIASHSSARKFTPGFERNMSDDMIKRLAKNGGVIMINFGSSFIDETYRQRWQKARDEVLAYYKANNLKRTDAAAIAYREKYRAENPIPFADISHVVAHFDHVVKLVGVDYVGLGSDYDGVGDSLPTGLKDVSTYPNLIYELLKKGYSEEDLEKICSGNLLRVWSAVEAHAKAASSQ